MIKRRFSHQVAPKTPVVNSLHRTPEDKVVSELNVYNNKKLAYIFNEGRIKLTKAENQLKTEVERLHLEVKQISSQQSANRNKKWGKIRAVIKFLSVMKNLLNKKKLHGLSTRLKYLDNIETLERTKKSTFRWLSGNYIEGQSVVRKTKRFLIYEDSQFIKIWSNVILLLFFYTAIFLPYKIAFITSDPLAIKIIDQIVNGLFIADILVSILSVYTSGGQIVESYWRIGVHYLTGWFIVDFLSIFPFDLFDSSSSYGEFAKLSRIFKLFKIFRIVKMTTRLKSNRRKRSITSILNINRKVEDFATFFLVIILLTHIAGCLWYFLSTVEEGPTWMTRLEFPKSTAIDQYIISLYWAITTICTVGFGDIYAVTYAEKIFNILWICVGVAFYSYVIGTLSSMLNTQNVNQSVISSRFSYLNQFAKEKNVSRSLIEEITHNLEYLEDNHHYTNNDEASMNFLKDISLDLTYKIAKYVHSELVERVILFYQKDINLLAQIIPYIFHRKFKAGEIIYKKNEYPSFVYFILSGRVGFFNNSNKLFKTYIEGSYFGEIELFKCSLRSNQVKALTDSRILILPRDNFLTQIQSFPEILEEMYLTAMKRDIINKKNGAYVDRLSFINFNSLITESQQADFIKHQLRCHQTILTLKAKIEELTMNDQKINKQIDYEDSNNNLDDEDNKNIIFMKLNGNQKPMLKSKSKTLNFGESMDAIKEKFDNLKSQLQNANLRLKQIIYSLKSKNLRVVKKFELTDAHIQCDLETTEVDELIKHLETIKPRKKHNEKIKIVSGDSLTGANNRYRPKTEDVIINVESMSDTEKLKQKYFFEGEEAKYLKPVKVKRFNLFNLKFFKKLNKNNRVQPTSLQKGLTISAIDSQKSNTRQAKMTSNMNYSISSKISDDSL